MANPLKYTCLFGGGAIRGIAYIGVIRAMEELGIEYDIIGGSSVGSIFATLLACGYKSYELENIFLKVNFDLFKDIHFGFGSSFAISKGEIFIKWLNALISHKTPTPSAKKMTFKDLDKNLVIITTNLTKFTPQEFSKVCTPDFEIAKAIRISSSMPGLMPPYDFNGNKLVDGDLQKASPMWKLSEILEQSKDRILEFRLEGECKNITSGLNPIQYINTIYSCVTDISTDFIQEIYGSNDRYDYIKISTGDVFFADLNLDKEARRKLIQSGYEQTMEYFKNTLPKKKEQLNNIYTQMLHFLKKAEQGLGANDVEEVEWWFGDLFTLMCENKEYIDKNLYNLIVELKNEIKNSTHKFLLIYNAFKNRKPLETKMSEIICILEEKAEEYALYKNKIS